MAFEQHGDGAEHEGANLECPRCLGDFIEVTPSLAAPGLADDDWLHVLALINLAMLGGPQSRWTHNTAAAQRAREAELEARTLATIATLPSVRVAQCDLDHESECVICAEDLTLDEELLELPCRHRFHEECIKKWLVRACRCPLCQQDVPLLPARAPAPAAAPTRSTTAGFDATAALAAMSERRAQRNGIIGSGLSQTTALSYGATTYSTTATHAPHGRFAERVDRLNERRSQRTAERAEAAGSEPAAAAALQAPLPRTGTEAAAGRTGRPVAREHSLRGSSAHGPVALPTLVGRGARGSSNASGGVAGAAGGSRDALPAGAPNPTLATTKRFSVANARQALAKMRPAGAFVKYAQRLTGMGRTGEGPERTPASAR